MKTPEPPLNLRRKVKATSRLSIPSPPPPSNTDAHNVSRRRM